MTKQISTPLTYYGGKAVMLRYIMPLIPDHKVYCEPFVGGGALYFAKKPVKVELINDTNNGIVTFYEVLKEYPEEFKKLVDKSLLSRYQSEKARKIYNQQKDYSKIELAWAVWFLGNTSFNGDFQGSIKFSRSHDRNYKWLINKKDVVMKAFTSRRLEMTMIDNRDALVVIPAMDKKTTFYYIDPPYLGVDQGHYGGYTEINFLKLLVTLSRLKGKFLLSCYPGNHITSAIKKYKWSFKSIKLRSASYLHGNRTYKIEVLVWNYSQVGLTYEIFK